MRIERLALALCLIPAALAAPNLYYVPLAADGAAGAGTVATTIVAANFGTAAANVTLSATRDDGSPRTLTIPGLGTNSRFSTRLAPGSSRLFTTDGTGDGSAGALQLSSDAPISVSALLTYTDGAGNPVAESAVPTFSDSTVAAEFRLPVDTTGALNSGVSLYNPGSAAAAVTLTLPGRPGATTIRLAPQGHALRFVRDDLFAGLGDFQGVLDVASTSPVAAAAIRGNAAAPTLSVIPASGALSHRLRFLLPGILDGPTVTGVNLQTTFLLANLSAKTANVALALNGPDGTPLVLGLPALGNDSSFTAAIPPGGSAFWQTDGSSATLASGAAVIRSDQPLAAAAVVTATDGQGAFLSESGIAPAPVDFQFVIPFDTAAGNAVPSAAIFNAGSQPVGLILKLLDPDGKPVPGPVLDPLILPPGVRFTTALSGFFPGSSVPAGSLVASATSPIASLAAVSLRSTSSGDALSSAPAFRLPRNPSPRPTVVNTLDAARAVTANIPITGGTLALTDAKGNRFTLTIPSGALLNSDTITMTAITSAAGLSGPGFAAGVQIDPDGLALLRPATLKIDLAAPAPDGVMPIGWRGGTPGVYLNPPLKDPNTLTLVLNHFSSAAIGPFDLTSELINIADNMDFYSALIAIEMSRARQAALLGIEQEAADDLESVDDSRRQWFQDTIEPLIELAEGTDDEDVMRCAITHLIGWFRQTALMNIDDSSEDAAVLDAVSYISRRAFQKLNQRCQQHDFTVVSEIIGAERQAELLGVEHPDIDIAACPAALQLTFMSEIYGVIPIGLTGTFDATINAKITLTGGLTKLALTNVTDPSKDLFTTFTLSGSGRETYDILLLTVNNVPANCSVTVGSKTPDTLTVVPQAGPQVSQVQFKFNPHYQPQALTFEGQQLCSFCPVYRKTPVKTEMWIDPGKPAEAIVSTCSGHSDTLPFNLWYGGWILNHATDRGFITGWDLQADPTFQATRKIEAKVTSSGATISEKTNLTLKPLGAQ